jgi:hypothetical protein
MRAGGLILLCLILAGCACPQRREADAEAQGYERGYAQAVKEQYWIIQNQQRRPTEARQPEIP